MIVKCFTFNDFQEHCYVISNSKNEAIVIDPGCCYEREREEFKKYISDNRLIVKRLLNTHLHIDHILGNKFIEMTYNIGAEASEKDESLLENMKAYAEMFGLMGRTFNEEQFSTILEANPLKALIGDGDVVSIDEVSLVAIAIPGHTYGHLVFYCPKESCVFVGDVLFRGSIGRTDLNGQDPHQMQQLLVKGIHEKLLALPEETVVFSGHGPSTTIGEEKKTNPFLYL